MAKIEYTTKKTSLALIPPLSLEEKLKISRSSKEFYAQVFLRSKKYVGTNKGYFFDLHTTQWMLEMKLTPKEWYAVFAELERKGMVKIELELQGNYIHDIDDVPCNPILWGGIAYINNLEEKWDWWTKELEKEKINGED